MKNLGYVLVGAALATGLLLVTGAQDPGSQPSSQPASPIAESLESRASYAIGNTIGTQLKQLEEQGFGVVWEEVYSGIKDMAAGKDPRLDRQQCQQAMQEMQQATRELQNQKREQAAKENVVKGKEFLAAKAQDEGVMKTDSGLLYKVVRAGSGAQPSETDQVKVHYRGTLIDGTQFDSSYDRGQPAQFQVKGVIKGWQEALVLMKEGAKYELYIPSELAYGERGSGRNIGPNAVLIFEVELLEVLNK